MQDEWQEILAAKEDSAKFQPLYDRYHEQIYRFVYRRTLDQALAHDICSEIFLKALQKLSGYQFKGVPFSAWLYRIASNEVSQHYRDIQKNRIVSIDDYQGFQIMDEMEEGDLEDPFGVLVNALNTLKPEDLELIEMRFFEERPFKEIAEIMGITESNAKVRTYRIIDRMKLRIGDHQNDD